MVEARCDLQQRPPQEPVLFTSPASGVLLERGLRRSWLFEACVGWSYLLWGEMQVVPGAVLIRLPQPYLFRRRGRSQYRWCRIEAAEVQSVQVMWSGYWLFGRAFCFFARDRTRGVAEAHLLPLSALSFLHVGEKMRRFLVALRQAGFQVEDRFGVERRSDFALWFWTRGLAALGAAVLVGFMVVAELVL